MKKFYFFLLILSCLSYAQDQRPQNIIILIGDGMGVNTVTTSILSDEETPFTKFNSVGFSITTSLDNLITDSAAGATAISTGTKTNNGFICITPSGEKLKTIFEEAEEKMMSTGIVVTSSVTHATPACFYAHTESRDNEVEIGQQLLTSGTDVVIGAGLKFYKKSEWNDIKSKLESSGYIVFTEAESVLEDKTGQKIFALIDDESVVPAVNRKFTLARLVEKAISILSQNKNGFILLVEGSQIDWAAHENDTNYLMSEMHDFAGAINSALKFAGEDKNTLVIVTADHETGGVAITDGDLQSRKLEISYSSFYHTAAVVPVFAKGPSEELFNGVYQNNEIGRKLFKILQMKN